MAITENHPLSLTFQSKSLILLTTKVLVLSLLDIMQDNEADFTLTFRGLCEAALSPKLEDSLRHLFKDAGAYNKWATNWRVCMSREAKVPDDRLELMHQANPAVIPRNHRIEQAIEAAVDQEDYGPFEKLLEVLSSPYKELEGLREYMLHPKPEEHVLQTFCGT